jgi:hypothetical protein
VRPVLARRMNVGPLPGIAKDPMADAEQQPRTYSVSVRLQRTTLEFAFVSVPVSPDVVIAEPDGTGALDVEKLFARAIAMGREPGCVWETESQDVQMHPIQMPPPGTPSTESAAG